MKIVKLRKNQKLYKQGFTHAFRFELIIGVDLYPADPDSDYNKESRVIAALEQIYNGRRWRGVHYAWERDIGSWRRIYNGHEWTDWARYYYVAVRREAVTTQVLLMME